MNNINKTTKHILGKCMTFFTSSLSILKSFGIHIRDTIFTAELSPTKLIPYDDQNIRTTVDHRYEDPDKEWLGVFRPGASSVDRRPSGVKPNEHT